MSARQRSAMEVLAAAMSEDDLLVSVTCGTRSRPGLCKLYGLKWYHPWSSKNSVSGWPDLVIAGPDTILFAELKTQGGRVSPAQREWITALEAAGQVVFLWRPIHFLSGEINRELAAIAKPRRCAA
jgi:VRR-NUC domain-containing protein